MPVPHGANIERRFIPLVPCPDKAGCFHIPKDAQERHKDWLITDTFVNPATGEAWMLVARKREEELN